MTKKKRSVNKNQKMTSGEALTLAFGFSAVFVAFYFIAHLIAR